MAQQPRLLVKLYPVDIDGKIQPTPTELTDITYLEIQKGIDKTKDTFSFEIPIYEVNGNWMNEPALTVFGDKIIRLNDVVAIYGFYGNNITPDDSNLLMYGMIRKWNLVTSGNKQSIRVQGINRTEELLRAMVPYTTIQINQQTATVTTIIKDIVRRINQFNPNHQIQAYLTTESIPVTGTSGGVQATKKDGTAFEARSYNASWKSAHLQFEQLSASDYTSDEDAGTYLFYIKPLPVLPAFQNQYGPYTDVLYWQSAPVVSAGSFVEGSFMSDFTITYDTREIVNAMIVNAGPDLNQNGILGIAYDLESMGKHGTKWAYYTKSNQKFSTLYKKERELGESKGSVFVSTTGFPVNFPWIMHFTGNPSAADEREFNQLLRNQARSEAQEEAKRVIELNKTPRYDINFDLEYGSNSAQEGQVYYFQIPSVGWEGTTTNPGKTMRIHDITHVFNNQGWQTRVMAKEDEQVIQQQFNGA